MRWNSYVMSNRECFQFVWIQSVKYLELPSQQVDCSRHEVLGWRSYGRRSSLLYQWRFYRKKYLFWGDAPSSFGRQQRLSEMQQQLSEITIEPITYLGAWARFWGPVPPGSNIKPPLCYTNKWWQGGSMIFKMGGGRNFKWRIYKGHVLLLSA